MLHMSLSAFSFLNQFIRYLQNKNYNDQCLVKLKKLMFKLKQCQKPSNNLILLKDRCFNFTQIELKIEIEIKITNQFV